MKDYYYVINDRDDGVHSIESFEKEEDCLEYLKKSGRKNALIIKGYFVEPRELLMPKGE